MTKIRSVMNNNGKARWKIVLFIFCVLFYMRLFSLLFKNSMNIYVLLNEVLCASAAFGMGFICFFNKDLKSGRFYKNIGAVFLVISVVSFIYIFINRGNMLKAPKFYEYSTYSKANYYLEYLVIFMAYILQTINKKIRYELFTAIIIPCGILFDIMLTFAVRNISCFDILSKIFLGIVLCSDCLIIHFNKIGLRKDEKKILFEYLFFISLYQYIQSRYMKFGSDGLVISLSLKFVSYYIMYILISRFVMQESYRGVENELIDVQKTQKELNNILKNRNRTLIELEHIIEKSSKKYSDLIQHISDGIVMFYFNKIYYINSEAEKLLKIRNYKKREITFDEVIEKLLSKNILIDEYDFAKEKIRAIRNTEIHNFKFNLKNHSNQEYEIYLFNIDSITRLVYIKDVTEINRNYEFKRKYKEYLKFEEAKNEFYSNISHELRTPINLIYSALQLSEINLNDNKIDILDKHNNTIKHNCLRLIRTINNFIDANKISEGYLEPNLKVYNIVSVVENISLACDRYMKKINNELIFDAEEEELFVECDKEMIERVVLNILSNSMKFGKNGGMTTVDVIAEYDFVIVQIRNNGYIVSEEEKPYIFDKFTKINKSLNRSNEGSGLGLYLSKALIELNKGAIELKSDDDTGTEFIIRLPRCYREDECEAEEDYDIIDQLSEKVDIEFSDIYI